MSTKLDTDDDGLDEFYDDTASSEDLNDELSALYQAATSYVRSNANQLSKETLLYLYARFKYANEGACNVERPGGLFNFDAKAKWDAWKALGAELSREQAKREYAECLDKAASGWRDQIKYEAKTATKSSEDKGTFGVRASRMADTSEAIASDQKTLFDVCREGDLDKLKQTVEASDTSTRVQLINQTDEDGMTLLMWSCDRGHVAIVDYLIGAGADVNQRDADGQTCLHYAVSCEHASVVQRLLQTPGVDRDAADSEGTRPVELATDTNIRDLFSTLKPH